MTPRATQRGRVRSSRPTYRRGGLKLGSANWTVFTADQLAPGGLIALLEDPVVAFQIELEDEAGVRWSSPSTAERCHLAAVLRDGLADAEGDQVQDEVPTFTLAGAFGDDFAQALAVQAGQADTPEQSGGGEPAAPALGAAEAAAQGAEAKPKREPKPRSGGKAKT